MRRSRHRKLVRSPYALEGGPDANRGMGVVLDAVVADDPRMDAAAASSVR
jgi:hypothetical protein